MKAFVKCVLAAGVFALGTTSLIADDSFEDRYKAKYGRPSPSQDAQQRAEENSSASRQEVSAPSGPVQNTWINDHHRGKYGRSTAYEERERGER